MHVTLTQVRPTQAMLNYFWDYTVFRIGISEKEVQKINWKLRSSRILLAFFHLLLTYDTYKHSMKRGEGGEQGLAPSPLKKGGKMTLVPTRNPSSPKIPLKSYIAHPRVVFSSLQKQFRQSFYVGLIGLRVRLISHRAKTAKLGRFTARLTIDVNGFFGLKRWM